MKKVLVLIPHPSARGGITNYYHALKYFFPNTLDYFYRGARYWPYRKSLIIELFRIFRDNILFFFQLLFNRYSLVQTTTSLSKNAILRDAYFILAAKTIFKKVIVFYRGWDEKFIESLISSRFNFYLFKKIYFKADAIIDLVQGNIDQLRAWGYDNPIYLETTLVDDVLVKDFDEDKIMKKYSATEKPLTILYLGRIEKTKGVYELMDSFYILKKKYPNLQLRVAGDGREDNIIKEYAKHLRLKDVIFTGYVDGDEKRNCFDKAHLFFFPSHFEGMPTSVLEAMAMGLPVVTRSVGGLVDFFRNGEHGYITDSKKPEVFADLISSILDNSSKMQSMALKNYKLAHERFLASKVAARMEKIFNEVLERGQ